MKIVIIQGSSRSEGNTRSLVDTVMSYLNCNLIDLKKINISHYDYSNQNSEDDFLGLMKKIIGEYDTLIFATPVYWYSMSGILKVFFDRITDLITIEKELGRKLKGKNMAVISTSSLGEIQPYFYLPFKESAKYLEMNYMGELHSKNGVPDQQMLKKFVNAFLI